MSNASVQSQNLAKTMKMRLEKDFKVYLLSKNMILNFQINDNLDVAV